jgi:hypothetical protein
MSFFKLTISLFSVRENFIKVFAFSFAAIVFTFAASVGNAQAQAACLPGQVVINEVYVSGGASGALYKNDFVELYNTSTTACSLANFTLQTATGTANNFTSLVSFPAGAASVIPAGGFYLIQFGGDAPGSGLTLQNPNLTSAINLDNLSGKLALVNSLSSLTGNCDNNLANSFDFVGYGATANCFEGTAPAPVSSLTTSISRILLGFDTNNNSLNFSVAQSPSPGAAASIPTAASVVVSGRVLSNGSRGISGVRVQITAPNGEVRTALTNGFGYFTFSEVVAGETYLVEVLSKTYRFTPMAVTVNQELTELNFTAEQ